MYARIVRCPGRQCAAVALPGPRTHPPPGSTASAIDEQRPSPGFAPTPIVSHAPDKGNAQRRPSLNDTTVSDPAPIVLGATAGGEGARVGVDLPYRARDLSRAASSSAGVFIVGRRSALRCADRRPTGRVEPAHHSLNALMTLMVRGSGRCACIGMGRAPLVPGWDTAGHLDKPCSSPSARARGEVGDCSSRPMNR